MPLAFWLMRRRQNRRLRRMAENNSDDVTFFRHMKNMPESPEIKLYGELIRNSPQRLSARRKPRPKKEV